MLMLNQLNSKPRYHQSRCNIINLNVKESLSEPRFNQDDQVIWNAHDSHMFDYFAKTSNFMGKLIICTQMQMINFVSICILHIINVTIFCT